MPSGPYLCYNTLVSVTMAPSPPQRGLEWKYQLFDVVPTWTVEPDIAVTKAMAIRHLPGIASNYEIKFFSAGAFNKLYLLHPLDDAAVLLRRSRSSMK